MNVEPYFSDFGCSEYLAFSWILSQKWVFPVHQLSQQKQISQQTLSKCWFLKSSNNFEQNIHLQLFHISNSFDFTIQRKETCKINEKMQFLMNVNNFYAKVTFGAIFRAKKWLYEKNSGRHKSWIRSYWTHFQALNECKTIF